MQPHEMKTADFAKRLRDRLAVLKKKHNADLEQFRKDFAAWKLDFAKWLKKNATLTIANITVTDIKVHNKHRHYRPGFDVQKFFEDAPKPPQHPGDSDLRTLRAALKQLEITKQKTVKVGEYEIQKYFGEPGSDDDS